AAGQLYAARVKGKGPQRIDILTGTEGAFNLGQRDKGFSDALKAAGVNFHIAATLACDEDTGKAVTQVESALSGTANLNGLFIDGPWPLLGSESNLSQMVSRAKSGQLTVVSFDSLQPELKFIQDGSVIGLVGQTYYDWGYQGVDVMRNVLAEHAKYPAEVDTGLDIVTPNGGPGQISVAQMNDKWTRSAFTATPIPPQSTGSK
ncbi:MAG: substrate-binding domain-containing protein, partial [Mycobacterium sp.]|nr:substrate-binding domain-containing protein [Mycobacterium sp.]